MGMLKAWLMSWSAVQETCSTTRNKKISGLTHGDDFVVTETKESVGAGEADGERTQIKASILGARAAKSIKALNRRIRWGETGILYQHGPRHVDVPVERLELENCNTVQTPTVDDVKDENPVWLDPELSACADLMWPGVCSSVRTERTKHSP